MNGQELLKEVKRITNIARPSLQAEALDKLEDRLNKLDWELEETPKTDQVTNMSDSTKDRLIRCGLAAVNALGLDEHNDSPSDVHNAIRELFTKAQPNTDLNELTPVFVKTVDGEPLSEENAKGLQDLVNTKGYGRIVEVVEDEEDLDYERDEYEEDDEPEEGLLYTCRQCETKSFAEDINRLTYGAMVEHGKPAYAGVCIACNQYTVFDPYDPPTEEETAEMIGSLLSDQKVDTDAGRYGEALKRVSERLRTQTDYLVKALDEQPTKLGPNLVTLLEALLGRRDVDQQRIATVGLQVVSTLLRKNADYGSSVFKSPIMAKHLDPGTGILVRLSDKVERFSNLSDKEGEIDESLDDTLKDMAGYAILYIARPQETEDVERFRPTKADWDFVLTDHLSPENMAAIAERFREAGRRAAEQYERHILDMLMCGETFRHKGERIAPERVVVVDSPIADEG